MILLRKLRHDKGISLRQLAEESGVDRFAITNIENKQYKTATKNMKKLADYFGLKNPTDLTMNVDEILKAKSCQNQKCLLNRECYCQSDQVCAGASCKSQNLVIDKPKKV